MTRKLSIADEDNATETQPDPSPSNVYDIGEYLTAGRASDGLIRVLARVVDESTFEKRPLYEVVDCDAIDGLLCPRRRDGQGDGVSVTFAYDDRTVAISADGYVVVRD